MRWKCSGNSEAAMAYPGLEGSVQQDVKERGAVGRFVNSKAGAGAGAGLGAERYPLG